ncbi:zinc finger BED domain-containing protein 4-like [Nothobranchius furzeri]|uniref:zinc finger BED domain-containing protein 4-like n=1 Tax=Nothobranchius furzeri TaxID=105023 RepID=UPI0039047A1D
MSDTEGTSTSAETEPGSTHLVPTETNIASGDGRPPPPKNRRTSAVWDSFTVCKNDPSKAMCKLCKSKISRGRDPKHYNTTSLHNHLLYLHCMRKPAVSVTSSSTSSNSPGNIPFQDTGDQLGAAKGSPSSTSSPPILTAFAAKQPFSANHPRSKRITDMIGKMICTDLEPFSVVERRGFKSLVAFLEPKYQLPSRHHFSRTVVPELYEAMRGELVQTLKAADGGVINLTTDLWTSNHNAHAYLCMTGHWCEHVGESSVQRKAVLLNVGVLDIEHTANNILCCLKEKMREWKESVGQPFGVKFVVSDNAANMVKALSEFGHIRCMSHTLHLVVIKALEQDRIVASLLSKARSISGYIHRSSKANNRLHELQTQLNLPQHTLITDIKTRWNYTFYMLQRLVEQCRAVQIMTQESNMGRTPTVIYPNEWGLASDMLTLLSPFEEVTRALSKHSASISEVIPLLHGLCSIIRSLHLGAGEESEDVSDDCMAGDDDQDVTEGQDQDGAAESRETLGAAARKLADNLSKELQWRFEPIFANTTLLHATLLDPRYKASCFPNSVDVAAPARITEETPATSSTSVLSFLHKKKSATPMRTHLPTGDVEAYLADGDISLSDDPVKYWSGKLQFWPKLTHFALQHLCCPPTSVQSECVFSTTGNVVSPQ